MTHVVQVVLTDQEVDALHAGLSNFQASTPAAAAGLNVLLDALARVGKRPDQLF